MFKNILVVATLLSIPFVALATNHISSVADIIGIIDNIARWFFWIIMSISVVVILLAALQFFTANGDPGAIMSARQKLVYAAIGIIVAVMSFVLPAIIASLVGVDANELEPSGFYEETRYL